MAIAVVDLFAGPGGLAEGFCSVGNIDPGLQNTFEVACSFEKDPHAFRTLRLRSMYRLLSNAGRRDLYFRAIKEWGEGGRDPDEILSTLVPGLESAASEHVFCMTLGPSNRTSVARFVRKQVGARRWVLVGGPPCQAYSLVGRSRNAGNPDYDATADERQTLYEEYLHLLAVGRPDAFVLENVKGLLSATVENRRIFSRMVDDLSLPERAVGISAGGVRYRLFSVVNGRELRLSTIERTPSDAGSSALVVQELRSTLVRMESYGVPQARHRVILLGVREDVMPVVSTATVALQVSEEADTPAAHVLWDMPALRSRISDVADGTREWQRLIRSAPFNDWLPSLRPALNGHSPAVLKGLIERIRQSHVPRAGTGGRLVSAARARSNSTLLPRSLVGAATAGWVTRWRKWYRGHIPSVDFGYPNHESRSHMARDLHRYLFASTYGMLSGIRSPRLRDFPASLHPKHGNLGRALSDGHFQDRFKVQLAGQPARTVTSHIHKDGHYYIHFDPTQARSFTVREAARLQTFPDSYVFLGPRTEQYRQVGNAVPPYFSAQIAAVIARLLRAAD